MSFNPSNRRKPLLQVENLHKSYWSKAKNSFKKARVRAIRDVSFTIFAGETYGLVGESGCGKSTLGKTLLRLTEQDSGSILYEGNDLAKLSSKQLRHYRKELQIVFQDPYSSLNPRIVVGEALEEPLHVHRIGTPQERTERAMDMLAAVGLKREHYYSLPHQLSGGQRQRIGLARALIVHPKLVVCDEPVSALDVIIQAQIIQLLKRLQHDMNLTYLFISHDISVVRHISDRIGVMYLGRLVEEGDTDSLFQQPTHPYTKLLLSAVPVPDPFAAKKEWQQEGELPSPLEKIAGCSFHTRCPYATERCRLEEPEPKRVNEEHWAACHYA